MRARLANLARICIMPSLALFFAASTALAQDRVPFRQEELDQMLAPIALYPDPLLSQILMAATYPLEIVQAARWSRANPGLKGEAAVAAVEDRDWDPSVKSLVAFPNLVQKLDEELEWTERLGEAFLAQQQDVMESVQALRRRAEAAGHLQSNERMRVERSDGAIVIAPPASEVVYVPYYSPAVVYGGWPWPAYPPVFWSAPSHYVVQTFSPVFAWGPAFVLSTGFFFGHADWHHRHVTVVHRHVRRVHGHRSTVVHRHVDGGRRTVWRHDPAHRRGVPFRSVAARRQALAAGADAPQLRQGGPDGRRAAAARLADVRQRRFDERQNAAGRRDVRSTASQITQPPAGNRAARAAQPRTDPRRASASSAQAHSRPRGESRASRMESRAQPRALPETPRTPRLERRANEPRTLREAPRQPRARAAAGPRDTSGRAPRDRATPPRAHPSRMERSMPSGAVRMERQPRPRSRPARRSDGRRS